MAIVNSRLVGISLLLGGCASGGAELGSDLAVRTALECEIEEFPEALPGPALLADTTALNADLEEMREAFDSAAVHGRSVALSMGYQMDGLNMRREILAHNTDPSVADSVQKLVFAHRHELPEAEREWGVRLLIDLDRDFTYRVERREYCPPRPRDREIESAMSTYLGTGLRYQSGMRTRTVVVRVIVHPAGYVAGGSIIRGGVTGSTFEQELLNYVRQFIFDPATIDGAPAYGHLDIPIQVRG